MAHEEVIRRSISLKQLAQIQFSRIDTLIIAQEAKTHNWRVRLGQYFPEGYVWDGDFQSISDGDLWGRPDGTAQFSGYARIPKTMAGKKVWLQFIAGSEVIVYKNGKMLDGIDPNRSRIILSKNAQSGEKIKLMMEVYTRSQPDDERCTNTKMIRGCVQHFFTPGLIVLWEEALSLKYDLDVFYELAFGKLTPEDVKEDLQNHVRQLLKLFPLYDCDTETLKTAVPLIRHYLEKNIYKSNSRYGHKGRLACVAHSHLDIAYHWKTTQTVQKNARTCLIQLRLMDRYRKFNYAHSQAWAYEMLEKYYPELFKKVKKKISQGKWEIVGGMYVEPDCNLLSAESLIRQIVYGKLYFMEKFGIEIDNCWLPDVFGNSAILPQILKSGGIDYFVSNKMSTWNDTNRFPHNNFIWRGLDGSEVNACVPPVHFISDFDPGQVIQSWEAFQDKSVFNESLHMYGYGDGGSGVTEEMLEYYYRLEKLPAVPRLRLTTGKEYLHSCFKNDSSLIPVWDGELYLEMHRGTFTTKARLKLENRKTEFLAQEVESLCALASLNGIPYPAGEIQESWKKILLNQFHDIIPGSHTNAVFAEAVETYKQIHRQFLQLKSNALSVIAPKTGLNDVCVFNPFGYERAGIAFLDNPDGLEKDNLALEDNIGNQYCAQEQHVPGKNKRIVMAVPGIPPLGIKSFRIVKAKKHRAAHELKVTSNTLENRFFRLKLDKKDRLSSIIDKKRRRNIVPSGIAANEWQLFEDKPGTYNAWDIIDNYEDHKIELPDWHSVEIVEKGPVSIAVRLKRSFSLSRAEQIIRLYADIPRIDFETWVDWQETERLLKVAFPVNIRSRIYTTDTSAGVLERANHRNTSWQKARFEVCCHKWVEMSEGLFGAAVLNNCKYGCDVKGNVMRLSLLRAPIRPDRTSDKGEHMFTYSLFTHDGDWRRSSLVNSATDLNWPLLGMRGRRGAERIEGKAGITIDNSSIRCMAMKFDEKGKGNIVLRLIELYGSRGSAGIKTCFAFKKVSYCDLLERPIKKAAVTNNTVNIQFRPYQILTVCFTL